MPDEVHEIVLRYKTDTAAAAQVKKTTGDLKTETAAWAAEVDRIASKANQLKRLGAPRDVVKSYVQAKVAVIDARDELESLETAAKKVDKTFAASHGAEDWAKRTKTAIRQSEENARLYGDIESRARAITGAIGYAGGTGVERAVNYGAEALAVREAAGLLRTELPRLTTQLLSSGRVTQAATSALQQYVPGMSAAAAQTTVAAGSIAAMGAAIVALGITTKIAGDIIKDSKDATAVYMAAQRQYAETIVGKSTQEVQEAIKANEDRNKSLSIERNALQALVDAQDDVDGFAGALLDFNDAMGLNLGGIEDVKKRLKEIDGEMQVNIQTDKLLTRAIKDGTTATADAAAREQELAALRKTQADAAAAYYQQMAQEQLQTSQREAEWSTEQVQQRLAQIQLEKQANQDLITNLENLKEAGLDVSGPIDTATKSLGGLMREEAALNGVVLDAAQARERETAAADKLQAAAEAAANSTQKAADAIQAREEIRAKFDEQQAQVDYERQTKLAQDAADAERKVTLAQIDHYRELADADQKYFAERDKQIAAMTEEESGANKERLKEIREFNKEDLRRAQDHGRELLDIRRRTSQSVEEAIKNRDIGAAREALARGREDAAASEDQYKLEKDRRQEDFDQRLRELDEQRNEKLAAGRRELQDLRNQHIAEQNERNRAFAEQMNRDATERQIQLQRQIQQWQHEDSLREQEKQRQLTAVANNLSQETAIKNQAYSTQVANAARFSRDFQQALAAAWQRPASSGATSGAAVYQATYGNTNLTSYGGYRTPGFASGGYPQPGARVRTGEHGAEDAVFMGQWAVVPNQRTQAQIGGITNQISIPISIQGSAGGELASDLVDAVEREVVPRLVRGLREAMKG